MNAQFYCDHPCFLSAIDEMSTFNALASLFLPLSVSMETIDTGYIKHDLVKQEAISNCNAGKWSSCLCILGLSSVLRRNIFTYYPDCGELRSKLLFNRIVQPACILKRV